uniref:Thiol-specific antioxidant protein n=1 Tax=Hildenbrandia rivularis TaxID=135206 RepID=A0A1C9CFE5_9FLOR|nr:thiol-specific antioxidant protein [Hildenbrandia rivularis]AOM67079.1 thiol-specific antioxidant protein [Hildenbrandia rivularis]
MESNDYTVRVGDKAPNFVAKAVNRQAFEKVNLSEFFGKKYVILLFYPYDFSFVCPTEIVAFNDKYDVFSQLNTQVLCISVDSHYTHLAWVQAEEEVNRLASLKYPLISDPTRQICNKYNVLDSKLGVALRALFIIDKLGIIQYSVINNSSFGRSVDETIRVLRALQHVEAYPEQYCPANWQPGDATITVDKEDMRNNFVVV